MKNIILILTLILTLSCKAQSNVVGYNSSNIPENAYCKDLNNDLNKFTGTWKFVNGNTELTIIIVKNEKVYHKYFSKYYIDELAGNYKYIENGIEIVNTLSNNFSENFSFSGSEMSEDTNKFSFSLDDPGKPRASYNLNLTYFGRDLNGHIKLTWKLMQTDYYSGYIPGETPPTTSELDQTIRLPVEVVLIKQ